MLMSDVFIYSQLLRCSTARRSSIGLSKASAVKVEAFKSFLFAEISFVLKKRTLG